MKLDNEDVKTNYVLIDYENVHVKSLALLKEGQFRVLVFLGPKNTKLPVEFVLAMQELNDHAEYIVLGTSGSNALDFHIAYYLGFLSKNDPDGFFHIISKDTGFDPLIQHLKSRQILSVRSPSIEEMPCFKKASGIQTTEANISGNHEIAMAPLKLGALIEIAVNDLLKRKAAKPRTVKTLRSTIHAKCGKSLPDADIDAVCEALVQRGYVKVDGLKVTYALPAFKP